MDDEAPAVSAVDNYWNDIVAEVKGAGKQIRHALLTNHAAAHLLMWAERGRAAPKSDICVVEAMLAYPSVNEFVRQKEREIARLVLRLREALDYVTDATEHWPVGSLEHDVARSIEARCLAEVEDYPIEINQMAPTEEVRARQGRG